jgi:hypothetical protein
MRTKLTFATILCLFIISAIAQQVPQALNYQAVARTANGLIIPAQNINVRFSVLDATVNGTVVYQETHTTATNSFGLFTLSIGKGTVVSGTFSGINWSSADKFLKVEISAGTSTYQLQGTTQLLSVPYALYSEKTKLLAGNNTINITNGNTITGNYQAANNTILVNGNTIAGNYQPANNTILVNGNSIAGNYQPGTGINITGNTIAHNMIAGTGINITGNTISATGSNSFWQPDANGINYQAGSVGIGTASVAGSRLTIQQVPTGGFSGALDIVSSDVFHTVFRFRNTTVNQEWQFMVGGSTNSAERPGALGIFNTRNNRWPFYIDPVNEFIGMGSSNIIMPAPKSRLHIFNGDINIEQIGSGIIMKSPNGSCWRVTIDDAGNLVRTAITCL